MLYAKLSDLTPEVVDALYNIDTASPSETPTFLFLVGAPGSGKSSGHEVAASLMQPPGSYATINLDILLESLLPFRAASSMAHYLKQDKATRDLFKFGSVSAYGARKENLGLFKWYDDARPSLQEADPHVIQSFNRIRNRFRPLIGHEASNTLMELNSTALARAIERRVNIVYETTISLSGGRVKKVDDIMSFLKKQTGDPYRVHFIHVKGSPANISTRLRARQEHGMPQEEYPFYRYVPSSEEYTRKLLQQLQEAFAAVHKKYNEVAVFQEIEVPFDPERLSAKNRRTASTRRRRILSAYAPRITDRPELYISPTTSERRKRTTQKQKRSSTRW